MADETAAKGTKRKAEDEKNIVCKRMEQNQALQNHQIALTERLREIVERCDDSIALRQLRPKFDGAMGRISISINDGILYGLYVFSIPQTVPRLTYEPSVQKC